jgi:fructose/tagatose bisphosphate aldolase
MKRIKLLFLLTFLAGVAYAQTARLQVIHNCAATGAAVVDVRVNGGFPATSFDNLAFRTATPFITVPAGVNLVVTINAPNSTDSSNALFRQTFNLAANGTFVVVASGTIGAGVYTPATPFSLQVFATGRETSQGGASTTDLLVLHGATDAPTVDVAAVGVGTLVNNISYGQFQGYISVPTANYNIQVQLANGINVVQEFLAPLATLNTGGAALTVVASGFLDSTVNNNGRSFGLFAATPAGGALVALARVSTTPARLQVIHNSAAPAAATVDVWLNNTKLLANFNFRTATSFINAPAGVPFDITIKGANSTDTLNPVFKLSGLTLLSANRYIAVASGNVGTGFNPVRPFSLALFDQGRETAVGPNTTTDVLVFHGATDAPAVDVAAIGAGVLVDTLSFGEFAGYLSLPTANYQLQVRPAGSLSVVQQYSAPLSTLNLGDTALVVLASGYLNPAQNNGGASFGLFVATAGGGALVQLPAQASSSARLEVIHNCAVPAADSVDIWLNNTKILPDFGFRRSSGFTNVPGGTPFDITVKLPGSTDTSATGRVLKINGLVLESAKSHVAIASGTVGAGFNPSVPFTIQLLSNAREVAKDTTKTDVMVFHGATDAPTVGVSETSIPAGVLVPAISYSQFNPAGYLELNPLNYTLAITSGASTVASFQAPLSTLNLRKAALTVLASGFLNPTVNSNGPAFGLWASTGAPGPLVQLPIVAGLSESLMNGTLGIYPNPVQDLITIELPVQRTENLLVEVLDMQGRIMVKDQLQLTEDRMQASVRVAELEDGMYLLRLSDKQTTVTKKIIVAK